MPESAGEKTEKATDHKRREERKKGNVMQSKDVVTATFILAVFGLLRVWIKIMYDQGLDAVQYWMKLAGQGMGGNGQTIDGMQTYAKLVLETCKLLIITAGPVLIVSMLVTIIMTGAQTRFVFSKELVKFKIEKLNPISGFQRMFSLSSAFELVKAILKLVVLVAVVYGEIEKRIPEFAQLFDMELVNGKADVVVIDSATANKYVSDNEGLKIVEDAEAFDSEEYAIAVAKGNTELLDKINASIEKLIADGTVEDLAAQYAVSE